MSCSKADNNTSSIEWLIPKNEVFDGGPGKDGIPSVDKPLFLPNSSITFMKDDDLVLIVLDGGKPKAYPHPILDWHEIVNDQIGDIKIAITYCPLTGTGIGWDRNINGKTTTFGVSGLLYQNNLLPYDRETNSNWSQMRLECVNGPLLGTKPLIHTMVETTWKTWKEMYPNGEVLSSQTGFNRNYGVYPYNDYKTSQSILFPNVTIDKRLHPKDRVHGIVSGRSSKAYPLASFSNEMTFKKDIVNGKSIILVGSTLKNMVISFELSEENMNLQFSPAQNELPVILSDQEGNRWDIFGRAIEGPRAGQKLKPTVSFIGYWFAWVSFYPDIELYQ